MTPFDRSNKGTVPEGLTGGDTLRISATFLHRQKLESLDYRTVETT